MTDGQPILTLWRGLRAVHHRIPACQEIMACLQEAPQTMDYDTEQSE
jgi:hypothetical protein